MALIKCPDCGKECSDQAEVCIHCGRPLKQKETATETSKREALTHDAVVAYRMRTSFVAPIIWMALLSSFIISFFFGLIFVGETVATILAFVIPGIFVPFLVLQILELVDRIKNNSVMKDPIIYHADTDEFEITHLNKESYFIKRTSLYRVKCAPKTTIYYYDSNKNLIKKPVWYVGNHDSLRAVVIKYMDKYNQ